MGNKNERIKGLKISILRVEIFVICFEKKLAEEHAKVLETFVFLGKERMFLLYLNFKNT